MRSLFSNRYNNSHKEFYERYEAARALHPTLPHLERPVEPVQMDVADCSSRRRYKSYRELAHQSREQLENDSWLSADRVSIVVRRSIEDRTNRVLMPRYDPMAATHEFSHNGIPRRRGRRPAAAKVAKIASDFAVQVGGLPRPLGLGLGTGVVKMETLSPQSAASQESDHSEGEDNEVEGESDSDFNHRLDNLRIRNKVKMSRRRRTAAQNRRVHQDMDDEDEENFPRNAQDPMVDPLGDPLLVPMVLPPGRSYQCPEAMCQLNFGLRRALYKHQRESGHHNWSHNCEKCGQVFRTAGFKRMHSEGACERNLQKQKF
ncbi:hypothetical protein KR009_005539, partial [Drosophila setifemur]